MSGTCTVIIPTYNEEKNIVNMAKAIREAYPDFKIRFMDDNSTDSSKKLIEELNDPLTKLVSRDPAKRGLAASVLQGILECDTDYFMNMDCDFQHPVSALADMYKELEKGCDLCIGTRVDRFALGFKRWAGSWVFNIFADLYLISRGKRISKDIMSGLFAGRADVFIPVIKENFDGMKMRGWKVLLDLLKFGPSDLKIANAYYKFGKRMEGESHISSNVIIDTFDQLGRVGKFCAKVCEKLKSD